MTPNVDCQIHHVYNGDNEVLFGQMWWHTDSVGMHPALVLKFDVTGNDHQIMLNELRVRRAYHIWNSMPSLGFWKLLEPRPLVHSFEDDHMDILKKAVLSEARRRGFLLD